MMSLILPSLSPSLADINRSPAQKSDPPSRRKILHRGSRGATGFERAAGDKEDL